MRKYIVNLKSIIGKVLIIGSCLIVLSAGAAFAEGSSVNQQTPQGQQAVSEDALLQKQKEIDRYLFEQHKADLVEKGITVTHTAPQKDYVEIGITPYNDKNAAYLYGIFGKDKVKVIEGQQAVTLDLAVASTTVGKSVEKADTSAFNSSSFYITFAGVVLLGFIVLIVRRSLVAGQKRR